jgi:hypothetical protein
MGGGPGRTAVPRAASALEHRPAEARKVRSVFYVVLMATRSRAKDSAGFGKGKSGRRPPVRAKSGSGVPLLPIVVGSILVVLTIVLIALIVINKKPAQLSPTVAGIPCDQLQHSQVHYHAALQIVYQGVVRNLRDDVGVQTDATGAGVKCYYWLHVHAADKNIIHIESPSSKTFTLGQFMDVWNSWSKANGGDPQLLDATHVSTFTLTGDEQMKVYIDLGDGKGAQPYTGDPRKIQLKSHEVITIEITPPDVSPPPTFTFPAGL